MAGTCPHRDAAMSKTHSNRSVLIAVSLAIGLLAAPIADAAQQLRIGYQKSSTLISLLKSCLLYTSQHRIHRALAIGHATYISTGQALSLIHI